MGQHDVSYRTLFSHRHLVESLIRGFLPAEWTRGLDFTTLVPVSEAHPTEDWSLRYNDCVWRLRWRGDGRWLYFYLMLAALRGEMLGACAKFFASLNWTNCASRCLINEDSGPWYSTTYLLYIFIGCISSADNSIFADHPAGISASAATICRPLSKMIIF